MNQPIHFDERLEAQERARLVHVLNRWIQKVIPNSGFIARRPGRRSVETQLRARPDFLGEAWRDYGPLPQVLAVLELLESELVLPNHNLIPDDPLVLLMNSAFGIDDVFAFQEFETRYGAKYSDEDFQRMKNEDWTLGQLIKDLLAREKGVPQATGKGTSK